MTLQPSRYRNGQSRQLCSRPEPSVFFLATQLASALPARPGQPGILHSLPYIRCFRGRRPCFSSGRHCGRTSKTGCDDCGRKGRSAGHPNVFDRQLPVPAAGDRTAWLTSHLAKRDSADQADGVSPAESHHLIAGGQNDSRLLHHWPHQYQTGKFRGTHQPGSHGRPARSPIS